MLVHMRKGSAMGLAGMRAVYQTYDKQYHHRYVPGTRLARRLSHARASFLLQHFLKRLKPGSRPCHGILDIFHVEEL
jgi:hypothetical protein